MANPLGDYSDFLGFLDYWKSTLVCFRNIKISSFLDRNVAVAIEISSSGQTFHSPISRSTLTPILSSSPIFLWLSSNAPTRSRQHMEPQDFHSHYIIPAQSICFYGKPHSQTHTDGVMGEPVRRCCRQGVWQSSIDPNLALLTRIYRCWVDYYW